MLEYKSIFPLAIDSETKYKAVSIRTGNSND